MLLDLDSDFELSKKPEKVIETAISESRNSNTNRVFVETPETAIFETRRKSFSVKVPGMETETWKEIFEKKSWRKSPSFGFVELWAMETAKVIS